jgi:hypothetical protein
MAVQTLLVVLVVAVVVVLKVEHTALVRQAKDLAVA